jgi:hypothetical protein
MNAMHKTVTAKRIELKWVLLFLLALILICISTRRWSVSAGSLLGTKTLNIAAALPEATLHMDYRTQLRTDGGTPPYAWKIESGHLPSGFELREDGTVYGRADVPGDYYFDTVAIDSSKKASMQHQSFSLRVAWNGLAVLTSNSELPWTRVGSEYLVRLTAAGTMPPFFFELKGGEVPEGLTLNGKGILSGIARRGGDYRFAVRVHDLSEHQAERSFTLHVSAAQVDRFGGVISPGVKVSATGHWHTAKLGNRWVLVTPEGHPFWMIGVWDVTGDGHKDEHGFSYDQRTKGKYGANEALRWLQANRRLHAWGFNTIGPYSYRMLLPTDSEPEWKGSDQPVKMPFVWTAQNPAITGRKIGIFKNLYAGLDTTLTALSGQGGANFPDVFDPAWERNTRQLFASDHELEALAQSPYFVGVFGDDSDFLSGFGPGPEFASQPPDKVHVHLGYLSLVTAPTQAKSNESGKYADTEVYTKAHLCDFLRQKYGSVGALNAAWGSTYTTLGSDGGWPKGGGLLDENGRAAHHWLGSGDPALPQSSGANPNMVRDLDEFLYLMARQFLCTEREALRAVAPKALFFGPTTIGGWWAPARAPIYRAARESLDVISVSTDASPEQVEFIEGAAGDTPLMIWEGVTANADSSIWRHAKRMEGAPWFTDTQSARAAHYRKDMERLFNAQTASGSHPFVGQLWWAWTDSISEERNWGLVSLMDNAYDGFEAGKAQGTDAWGYPTGGEEHNYGDFLGPAREVNFSVVEKLRDEQH